MMHSFSPHLSFPPFKDVHGTLHNPIALRTWIETLAYQAGSFFLKEFHRPQGPRKESRHKAPIDREVELFLRQEIHQFYPDHGIFAEERPDLNRSPQNECPYSWYIDPNDGTSAFLKTHRGSALSIALVYDSIPVFGIVYAFCSPHDQGDFISGGHPHFGPLSRN